MLSLLLLQETAEGDFIAYPILVFFFLVAIVAVAIYWYTTHCPNCQRIFTRELVKKEKGGLLPTAISGKERRTYRCKQCGHEWQKTVYVGD
ncbi:MAG: zinc-ribbon domain-containing protein [Candidatus Promineifilaceae bacterium]|jgi:transposase-like protein